MTPTETHVHTETVRIDAPSTKGFNFLAGLEDLTINVTHAVPQKYGFQDAFWIGFGLLGGIFALLAAAATISKLIGLLP